MSRLVKIAALCLALPACASLNPAAIGPLSRLDILSADPAAISVAAVMPSPTRLRSGDAVMVFALDAPAPYGVKESIGLEVVEGADAPGVSVNAGSERLQVLRVPARDLARLKAAQDKAAAYKKSLGASGGANGGIGGKGRFTVGIAGGCRDGEIGAGPLIAAISMRTDAGKDYFPVMDAVDLRKLAGEEAIAKVPLCG